MVLNLFAVRLNAVRAVNIEGNASIAKQADGFQNVPCHNGLENVELEVALRTSETNGCIITEHLGRDHGHGLALGRVDLTGHDGRTGLILGNNQLANAVARAGGIPAHIVGNLHQRISQNAQRARDQDESVVRTQGCEEVIGLLELNAGFLRNLLRGELTESGVSIEAGSHCGSADRQFACARLRVANAIECEINLCNPAGNNLAKSNGGCVLEVGAAHHDDIRVFLGLCIQSIAQLLNAWIHRLEFLDHGNVHCSGEGVIRGLAAVHMVIGVNGSLGAHDATGKFDCAVGDDLVRVHVRLRAGSGLEDDQREVIIELALDDLVGGASNQVCDVLRELAEFGVCKRSSLLQSAKCANHGASPHESVTTDVEVVERTLCLCAPITIDSNLNGAHGIGFGTSIFCHECLLHICDQECTS